MGAPHAKENPVGKTKSFHNLALSRLSLCKDAHGRGRRNGTCMSIYPNLSSTEAPSNAKHVLPVWHKIWRTIRSVAVNEVIV